jgi:hypothetical protein
LLVPEPFQKEFGKKLSEANITFVIKIADLEKISTTKMPIKKLALFQKANQVGIS